MKWPARMLMVALSLAMACSGSERVEVRPSPQDKLPKPSAAEPPIFEPPPPPPMPDSDEIADALGAGGYAVDELVSVVSKVQPTSVQAGVHRIYVRSGGAFVWSEGPYITPAGKLLLYLLERVENHGLSLSSVSYPVLSQVVGALQWNLKLIKRVKPQERQFMHLIRLRGMLLGQLDAQLTGAALVFSQAVRPSPLKGEHLANIIPPAEQRERWVRRLLPWHPQYRRLVDAMPEYRQYAKKRSWGRVKLPKGVKKIGPGYNGKVVLALRKRLKAEGFTTSTASLESPIYDTALQADLEHFQYTRGLEPKGILDEKTLEALNVSPRKLLKRLKSALAKWRTSPTRTEHSFVQVNLPEFMVEVYKRGKRVRRHNAVIGYAYGTGGGRTKEFHSEIHQVVVNPTWTPSDDILNRELLPKERAEPGYLQRKGFQWFTRPNGKKGVYQASGKGNTLGRAMLRFPNENNIYLHGSTDDAQFSRAVRAASHGCVRVQDIEGLALSILTEQFGITEAQFKAQIETQRIHKHTLKRPIPVHFEYVMTVVDDDGTVRFLPNVYKQ